MRNAKLKSERRYTIEEADALKCLGVIINSD